MGLSGFLMIAAGVCFVLESVSLAVLPVKWWALGVAFYLFAQVA